MNFNPSFITHQTSKPDYRKGGHTRRWKQLLVVQVWAAASLILYWSGVLPDTIFWKEVIELACVMIFMAAVYFAAMIQTVSSTANLLSKSRILYLGGISYGLYVIHNFVPDMVRSSLAALGYSPAAVLGKLQVPAFFVVTVSLAMLSWHCFEKPINQLKSRFPYVQRISSAI